ncbi:MAG: hypothetical protein A3E78_08435 [Alphaproteobacteria bacterium RIFCSPHIGHO2_12_FULL_63_12]|nr:MAG: hypothetical protein A3E78_08435 [Alphaproteobacteria bacterium RIFCSPHIGHO2_12_FULL_63_12]
MAFVSGSSTPFGLFDSDATFRVDADKVLTWVNSKLGDPVMCVELTASQVYASFEEACVEYGSIVNSYQAKSTLHWIMGSPTGTLSGQQNRLPQNTLEFMRRAAMPYGDLVGAGGIYTLYSGSITTVVDKQDYDLQDLINPTGSDGLARRMYVQQVYHSDPLVNYRFFGSTSTINYLSNQLQFESYTPETVFYLLPVWEDILRGMQFKESNRVRRSHYSYAIHNNVLKLFPPPTDEVKVWFTYHVERDPFVPDATDRTLDGVANLSNVPFGHIAYSRLNSISRTWIWRMTLAYSKETLGLIRGKLQSIPVDDREVTLNGAELVNDGRGEQEQLRQELRQMLEETTYDKLSQREAERAEALNRQLSFVPLKIYVG